MDKLKKLRSKVFKNRPSASPAPAHRDPKLRHSRSMPLRSSNETEESHTHPRPIYRGEHPLRPLNITYILDISPEADWPRYGHDDHAKSEQPEIPEHKHVPLIDRNLIDEFPVPPTTLPSLLPCGAAEPIRPPRPPTMHFDPYLNDYILPDVDPRVKARLQEMAVLEQQERRRVEAEAAAQATGKVAQPLHIGRPRALQPRQPHQLRRSASSTSRYWRPTTGYSKLAATVERDRACGLLPRNFDLSTVPRHNANADPYSNATSDQSTCSLADPRYRAALADHQRRRAAAEASSTSTPQPGAQNVIYGNSTGSQSTRSLGPTARFHAAPNLTNPIRQASMDDYVTVSRRNASSASSRSALAVKRHAIAGQTPPPTGVMEMNQGTQHLGASHGTRGAGGGKLQCPVPVRPVRFDLLVNDGDAAGSSKGGKPVTIAGQGRGGVPAW